MTSIPTEDVLDDEDKTLPPIPPEDDRDVRSVGAERADARGDFRNHLTTLATRKSGDLFQVRLVSQTGDAAHFAMDARLAERVARELERQLADHYDFASLPAPPALLDLEGGVGTDVFFMTDDSPTISVRREEVGGRIVLKVVSEDAYLRVTMHSGVACAIKAFLSDRPIR
jgi:hypothetical protein